MLPAISAQPDIIRLLEEEFSTPRNKLKEPTRDKLRGDCLNIAAMVEKALEWEDPLGRDKGLGEARSFSGGKLEIALEGEAALAFLNQREKGEELAELHVKRLRPQHRGENEVIPRRKRFKLDGFYERARAEEKRLRMTSKEALRKKTKEQRRRSVSAVIFSRLEMRGKSLSAAMKNIDLVSLHAEEFRDSRSDDPFHAAKASFFRDL